jgi:nicotinamide-nucleotide amidase
MPLLFQPHLFEQINDYFRRVGRPPSPNNRKQAYIPEGATPIENPVGTAPGFIAEQDGKAIISIPGVPHEMRYFMEHSVLPYLRRKLGIREIIVSRVLKLFGIGESLVDERIKDLIEKGTNPTIGLLAHTQIGEIHIRLTAKAADETSAAVLNASLEAEIRNRLKDFIFAADEETYEGVLSALLQRAGLTLAVAETSFGSSIIQTMKGMEGSRDFFRLGLTVVNPAMARRVLNLPASLLTEGELFGPEAARALAEGIRSFSGADLGLGLTGRVGKEKGQDHLIYIVLAHAGETEAVEQRWPFAMRFIENRMTKMALAQVRKYLLSEKR